MAIDVRTMVSCAVDDDAIWITDVDFAKDGSGWRVSHASKPTILCDRGPIPNDVDDDQANIDFDAAVDGLCEVIEGLGRPVNRVGIASFGNVDPKTGVIRFVRLGDREASQAFCPPQQLRERIGISASHVTLANDATAAALGEWTHGVGKGTDDFAYVWCGRGVNVGLMLERSDWRGKLHPEAGHMLARRDYHLHAPASADIASRMRYRKESVFEGCCAEHDGCTLGLCCLRAVNRRLKEGWSEAEISDLLAYYYAQLCLGVSLMVAPERIAMGGLMVDRFGAPLIDATVEYFNALRGSYPQYDTQRPRTFIRPAERPQASLWGMVEMARRELGREE